MIVVCLSVFLLLFLLGLFGGRTFLIYARRYGSTMPGPLSRGLCYREAVLANADDPQALWLDLGARRRTVAGRISYKAHDGRRRPRHLISG